MTISNTMNRRDFLKRTAGFTFGLGASSLALPHNAKAKLAAPVGSTIAKLYLDDIIRSRIRDLKSKQPHLKIGETHCHTIYSDGNFEAKNLMTRAAALGLDFIVITEHFTPKGLTSDYYELDRSILSFQDRKKCLDEWEYSSLAPVRTYPAFEISTLQGHLILVFPEDYLNPKLHQELRLQFSRFEKIMASMAEAAELAKPFGAISIIPHPEVQRSYPFGAKIPFIQENLTGLVDGIEDISTGHGYNENFSEEVGMTSIGSSDDHFNFILGTSVTGFNSEDHSDFLSAVHAKETQAIIIEDSLHHFFSAARMIL